MLDEIKDRYRLALETGIFSQKDGKIRKNCRLAKQYEALTRVIGVASLADPGEEVVVGDMTIVVE